MLNFISEDDYLLVDKYKQNDDGSVSWFYDDGISNHSGFLFEGMTRTKAEEDGTELVVVGADEDGVDITEEVPKYVEVVVDIWAKLQEKVLNNVLVIEGKTQEEIEKEMIAEFKASRQALVDNSIATVSTGKSFDADEQSISRLLNSIIKHLHDTDDTIIKWSTADVSTGVMVDCTKAEIVEAHKLAVEYVEQVWSIE